MEEPHSMSMIRKLYQLFMRVHSMLTIATFVRVLYCLSICLSVHMSVCPLMSICLSPLFVSVSVSVCLLISLSVYVSALSVFLSVHVFVCLFFWSGNNHIETAIQRHQQIYYICRFVFSHACLSLRLFLCIIMLQKL